MMIADSCEAASRSLAEPTPDNIRFIVTKIIDAIVADDQLGECDLTLRELTQIREAMIRSLIAIYHSRVDYPGYVPPSTGQFKFTDSGTHEITSKSTEPEPFGVMDGSPASTIPANLDAEERGLRYRIPPIYLSAPAARSKTKPFSTRTALIELKRRRPDVLSWKVN